MNASEKKIQAWTAQDLLNNLFEAAVIVDRLDKTTDSIADESVRKEIAHWLYQINTSLKLRGITPKE